MTICPSITGTVPAPLLLTPRVLLLGDAHSWLCVDDEYWGSFGHYARCVPALTERAVDSGGAILYFNPRNMHPVDTSLEGSSCLTGGAKELEEAVTHACKYLRRLFNGIREGFPVLETTSKCFDVRVARPAIDVDLYTV